MDRASYYSTLGGKPDDAPDPLNTSATSMRGGDISNMQEYHIAD